MSTPHNPNGQQPFDPNNGQQPYNGQQQNERVVYVEREPEKKKKGGCMKWGFIILAVLFVLGLIISAMNGSGDSSSTSSNNSSSANDSSQSVENNDDAAQAVNETATTDFAPGQAFTTDKGLEIVVNSVAPLSTMLGEYTCGNVTYTNTGDKQQSFEGYFDWKLQNPAGVIVDPTFTGQDDNLQRGDLAPGGTVTGQVCFDGIQSGEQKFVYKPTLSFSGETATWVAAL